MTSHYTDPATGEQYTQTDIHCIVRCTPPVTGIVYDRLRSTIRRADHETAAVLDNILTRLEAETTPQHTAIPFPHRNTTTELHILSHTEQEILKQVFTVPETVYLAPVYHTIREQLRHPTSQHSSGK